jgi:hypothetical protein
MMRLTLRSQCVGLRRKIRPRYLAGAPVSFSPDGAKRMAQNPKIVAKFDAGVAP